MEINIFENKNWSLKSSGLIIKYKNINELWNSESYVSLRNKHSMKKRKQILPCNRCNVV